MKADDIFASGNYVMKLINRSALLVADVTDKNPNVFYDLGIAHTIGTDVILISKKRMYHLIFKTCNITYIQQLRVNKN
jgi:hypothetical protein